MSNTLEKPNVATYTLNPYSARALILKLEREHSIAIRVHESAHYCLICIDKEDKKKYV